jgi:hypothetical protein
MKNPALSVPSFITGELSALGDRLIHVLALVAACSALAGFCLAVFQAPSLSENDHRLAPTFALAHGYRLYYGPEEGPVLSTIYGPVVAVAYAPSLLASTPMAAVRFATIITIILFFLPMFLVAERGKAGVKWPRYLCVMGLAAALTSLSTSLETSSLLVHADAPALAAGALACWLSSATGSRFPWRRAALAGLFTSVAVMAKQNMVPLAFALGLWWLLVSWRSALVFVAGTVASLLAIWTGTLAISTSLGAAWFNWFQIPAHQPYDKAMLFSAVDSLDRTLLLYLLPIGAIIWGYMKKAGALSVTSRLRPLSVLLLWVGCCLVPTSVLGRIKAGGSDNALSPAIYFFALASMLELSAYLVGSPVGPGSRTARVALLLVLGTYVVVKLPENVYSLSTASGYSEMETVYNFSRSHPGQVYFPQFPLTILMAEDHLYDFSWGLSDRRAAGHPVSDKQFLEHTPPSTQRMALMPWVPYWEKDIYSRCRAGTETQEPSLPAFTICRFR